MLLFTEPLVRGDSGSNTGVGGSPYSLISSSAAVSSFQYGPVLVNEPAQLVSFGNDTGLWVTCTAQGSPAPEITWIEDSSGLALMPISGLR